MILLVLELAYFKVADRFNIIDKPNQRSSHSSIVLRGGGDYFSFGVVDLVGFCCGRVDTFVESGNRGLQLVPAGSDVGCWREFH